MNVKRLDTIPEEIFSITGSREYTESHTGMSGSKVLLFPEHVLKLGPHTEETDNAAAAAEWLRGKVRVPRLLLYRTEDGIAYTLRERVKGIMLCDISFLMRPEKLAEMTAEAILSLWRVDISDCPLRVSRLSERLKAARRNVEEGLVDIENTEPDTFGPHGFADPEALLYWLEKNRPEEDPVMTHGDLSLPNLFAEGDEFSGFIDLGKAGPADRWQDVAIALRSLRKNIGGEYGDGVPFGRFEPRMLLEPLGLRPDPEKERYYMLLDELF